MDLDPFSDVFSDQLPASRPGTRAGGKFKPKSRPPKPIPSTTNNNSTTDHNQLNEKQGQLPSDSITKAGEWHSSIEKSPIGENCDIYTGIDSIGDSLPQTATTLTDTPTVQTSDSQYSRDGLMETRLYKCNGADARKSPEGPALLDTLMGEDGVVLNNGESFHIESPTKETENAEDFPCLETQDFISLPTSSSGQGNDKFQQEPTLRPCKTRQYAMGVPSQEEIEYGSFVDSVPSQTECMVESSVPAYSEDDVIDLSSIGHHDSIHTEATSDFQVNLEKTNGTGTSHSDATLPGEHQEAVCEMPGKRTNIRRKKGHMSPSISLEHQNTSPSTPEDQVVRSSERLRKKTNSFQLLDEPEDMGHNGEPGLENVDYDNMDPEYVVGNENNNDIDQDCVVENDSLNGRRPRSKKPAAEKKKPGRKRKVADGESVEPIEEPKKRFSHSTRRNKRRVNPDLLKVPEDEMDFHNLTLRTFIRLAEHKKRREKSEATPSEAPVTNQSNTSFSGYHDEDEASQGRGSADEFDNFMPPEICSGYNYHTHMKKPPRARWSKHDTELFYEVLQQFGPNLTMIARYFCRTRHQIKLKYKKEERQIPVRLRDALATRPKGVGEWVDESDLRGSRIVNSHYKKLIERLKPTAAQNQEDNRDYSINLTGEEAEEAAADMNEASAKSRFDSEELHVEMEAGDVVPPAPTVETSLKPDENEIEDEEENEESLWSNYKSEIEYKINV